MKKCVLCERRCRVNRLRGKRGYCRVLEPRIVSTFVHVGEEPMIVPSYTIFFSGCTLSCVYCQNCDISFKAEGGRRLSAQRLSKMIENQQGINVNWVGGDPTPNIPFILQCLSRLGRNLAQVFNSNMYLSRESMQLLDGTIDLYLSDFKYGNDECAERLSDAPGYSRIVKRNHLLAQKQAELLIRHLVLPGHFECCTKPVLDWISENLSDPLVNVMGQYRPMYKAREYEELKGTLSYKQYQKALDYARSLNLSLVN